MKYIFAIALLVVFTALPVYGQEAEEPDVQAGSGLQLAVDTETGSGAPIELAGKWRLETDGALIRTTVFDGMESKGPVTTFVRDFRNSDLISERYIRESNLFRSLEFVEDSILRITREDGDSLVCVYHVFSSAIEFTYSTRFHISCRTSHDVQYLLSFLPRPGSEDFTVTYALSGEPAGEHYSAVTWQAVATKSAE